MTRMLAALYRKQDYVAMQMKISNAPKQYCKQYCKKYYCAIRRKDRDVSRAGRLRLIHYGTRWRTGGEVKGKLANEVGSQYSSHYLRTWCIQHYYRWCTHLGCQ